MNSTTHRSFIPFRLAFALLFSSVGVFYPYYVLYFKSIGIQYSQLGLILALQGIVAVLFSQLWGYVSDMLISKKMVLGISTIGCGAFFVGLYYGYLLWHFIILIFLLTLFSTPRQHILNSILFHQPGGRERFGFNRAYGSLGFIVMNIITGKCAAALGLTVIFPLYLFVSLLFLIVLVYLPEDRNCHTERKPWGFWKVQYELLKDRRILLLLLVVFFNQCAHCVATIYLSFIINDLDGNEAMVGLFFSYAALLEIPTFFILDRLIASVGEIRLIAIAILSQALRWLLTYYADSLNDFFIIQSLHCLTFGVFYLATASYMNRKSPPELRASAQTLLGMVYFGIAVIVGQSVGGFIAQIKGLRELYLFILVFVAIAFLFWIKLAVASSKPTETGK